MSGPLDHQLAQDKALRDAALELVKADVSHLRTDLNAKSVAARFANRMSEGAADLYEEAASKADDNRGILAALMAAIALWFARNPILSLFSDEDGEPAAGEEITGEQISEERGD